MTGEKQFDLKKAHKVKEHNKKQKAEYSIKTFGCKVNTYDSALIHKSLTGFASSNRRPATAKIHIINTCAVTEEAVKEAKRHIRRYRKKHPQNRIVVTGCAAQTETEGFSSLKEVDLVVANSHKGELAGILKDTFSESCISGIKNSAGAPLKLQKPGGKQKVFKSSIFKKHNLGTGSGLEEGRTRLFLKIQDGCNSFCTFCLIPFARGKSRSCLPADLVRFVKEHYERGVREVVLTGVHIGDYQWPDDETKGLADLVSILLKKTKMPRIRLSSLEPPELSEELLELFSDPRLCPHFHLSIQSAHSEVLKKMKRQYSARQVESALMKIQQKAPKAFVGMDLIAGFAGETQAQFEDTYCLLKNLPWTKIHVFPYSPRPHTYAQKAYTSCSRSVIMKRAVFLRRLSEDRLKQERNRQIGTVKFVLPLKYKNPRGLSRDYWPVLLPEGIPPSGKSEEQCLCITSVDEETGCLKGVYTN